MDIQNCFNGFHLNNDKVIHQNVQTETQIKSEIIIINRKTKLPFYIISHLD